MATFYGGVSGSRGDATRQGTADSGMEVYAQSHSSRITVDYGMDRNEERPVAHVTLGGGWTTYYRDYSIRFHPDQVAAALDSGDEKMISLWRRIQALVVKLDDEAPKALRRAERARKAA